MTGNQELYQVGINIVSKISGNLKPQVKEIIYPEQTMDNDTPKPIIIYKKIGEMTDPALNKQEGN